MRQLFAIDGVKLPANASKERSGSLHERFGLSDCQRRLGSWSFTTALSMRCLRPVRPDSSCDPFPESPSVMNATNKTAAADPALSAAAVAALHQASKIEAIKIVREDRNIGLKDAVDHYVRRRPAVQSSLAAAQAETKRRALLCLAIMVGGSLLAYFMLATPGAMALRPSRQGAGGPAPVAKVPVLTTMSVDFSRLAPNLTAPSPSVSGRCLSRPSRVGSTAGSPRRAGRWPSSS